MKLLKVHLLFFMLLCFVASAMSANFQPPTASHHHGRHGCGRGRGPPWPNDNNGDGNPGGNTNNNSGTNTGNTGGQGAETEQA